MNQASLMISRPFVVSLDLHCMIKLEYINDCMQIDLVIVGTYFNIVLLECKQGGGSSGNMQSALLLRGVN